MRHRFLVLFLLSLVAAGLAGPASARVVLQPVVGELEEPVYVTHARDGSGRLFIVEQPGRILVLPPGATKPTVFLDIRGRVLAGGERGLLGLAFHPAYPGNGRFFVNYTRRPDGATVIAELRVSPGNPDVAASTERTLLVIPQPFENHNGGMVEFGPDGMLYVGMGDGGDGFDPGNRAQNPADLLGKILRLDVDAPGDVAPAIFASGFRNPWRFSFDRASGELYAGDVGENQREEIDVVTAGGNYGWRVFEGTRCTNVDPQRCGESGFIPPILEYGHTSGRCSVTGGYVYRGHKGTLASGAYVFGDYCSGEIFVFEGDAFALLLDTDLSLASFGEDQAGELYVVSAGGTVHRLANPDAPSLSLAVNQTTLSAGDTLQVSLALRNGNAPVAADEFFGIVHPDGATVTFITGLAPLAGSTASLAADARTFPPLVSGLGLAAGTDETTADFFTYGLTGAEPAGTYVIFTALARPGHLADGRVDPGDLLAVASVNVVVSQ